MKKLLSLVFCGLLLFGCSDKYDDSALRNDLNDLENRVAKLEELCKQMNTNISSLQKLSLIHISPHRGRSRTAAARGLHRLLFFLFDNGSSCSGCGVCRVNFIGVYAILQM